MFTNIWQIIKSLWFVWTIIGIVVVIRILTEVMPDLISDLFYERKRKKRFLAGQDWRSDRELLWMLRGMKPEDFEEYIADLFFKMGFKTEITGGAYDEGVDVIAEKDGIRHYIQCKKFITQEVSVGAVRDFYGAIADHLATGRGYFITTNKFTLEAERFAEDKPIELIDGFKLIKYIRQAEKQKK